MNLNKQQLDAAVDHGIRLLSGQVEGASVPYSDNVFFLKQLLITLATGQLALVPPMRREKPPVAPPEGEPKSPAPEPQKDAE